MAIQTVFLAENTTAYATDVMNLVDPLYTDLDGSNVSDKTGTGTTLVLSASPTFTGSVTLNSGADLKIYSDVGTTLKFFVDGTTGSFGIPSGQKFYCDGTGLAGDTYLSESSANVLRTTAGGNTIIEAAANFLFLYTDFSISPTKQFYLDDGSDTSFRQSSDNVITAKAGGVDAFAISPTGASVTGTLGVSGIATFSSQVLLPDVDPPTANYANRNGIVKAWGTVTSAPTITASYNISSAAKTSTGVYQVFFNTNFANTGYGISITAKQPSISVSVTQNVAYFSVSFVDPSSGAFTDCAFSFIAVGDQ